MPHLFTFEGHGTFSPDGKVPVTPEEAAKINEETNAAELAHWATKPDTFAPAYYTFSAEPMLADRRYRKAFTPRIGHDGLNDHPATVSTWRGTIIGRIISARVYGHNFGGRVVSIRVRGTNGATYYGRASWDNGSVIRLRKAKR